MAAQVQTLWQNAMISRSFDSVIDRLAALDDLTLVTTPSLFIIAFTPIYMRWHRQSEQLFTPSILLWLKLATSYALVGVQIVSLLSYIRLEYIQLERPLATSFIAACAAICLSVAINIEHRHASNGSAAVALWLPFSVSCDAIRLLIYPDGDQRSTIGSLIRFGILLKGTLMLLEEIPKAKPTDDQDDVKKTNHQRSFGFWSRLLWRLLPSTLKFGFSNQLSLSDLDDLYPEYSSERLALRFQAAWEAEDEQSEYRLYWALFRSLRGPFLVIVPPYLLTSLLLIAQATFISRLLSFLENDMISKSCGLYLIAEALGVQLGITVCRAISKHLLRRSATFMRGMLTSAVYTKTFKLPYTEAQKAAAVTLIGNSIETATTVPEIVLELSGSTLQVLLGLFVLMEYIGLAAYMVFVPMAASALISFYIGSHLPAAQKLWQDNLGDRVSRSLTFLSQIKAIRVVALEDMVAGAVARCYEKEIASYVKFRFWSMLVASINALVDILPMPLVLGAYVFSMKSAGLTSQPALSTLAMTALLGKPIHIIFSVPAKVQSFQIFGRVQDFLLLQEVTDPRINMVEYSPGLVVSTTSINQTQSLGLPREQERGVLAECVIRLEQVSVAPQGSRKAILSNINIAFNRNELITVSGLIGSGKSTLLQLLIGEATRLTGKYYVEPGEMAYCNQTPWLRHASARDNIVNGLEFDQHWYDLVLSGCMLEHDLQQWAGGDKAMVSTNGANLSGGQRQRLALARSLYMKAPYLVLDNVFGSLDRETAKTIFDRLFNENGLMQLIPTTVILVTHLVPFIKSADQAVFVNANGAVSSFQDLESDEFRHQLRSLKRNMANIPSRKHSDCKDAYTAATSLLSANQQEQENIRRTVDWKLCLIYLTTFDLRIFILWLPCIFIGSFSEACPELFMRIWLEVNPENNMFLLGFIFLSLSALIFTMMDVSVFFSYMVPASASSLHLALLNTITSAKLEYLTRENSAALLKHLIHDMTIVSHALPTNFICFVAAVFTVPAHIAPLVFAAREMMILFPIIIGAIYGIQRYYLYMSREIRYLDLEHKTPLLTQITEISSGLQHVRAFGWQRKMLKSSLQLLDMSQKTFYHKLTIDRWLYIVMDMFTAALIVLTVMVAVVWREHVTTSSIGLPLTALISANLSVRDLICTWASFETSMAAFGRLYHFITTTPIEKEKVKDYVKELPRGWPRIGNIEMKDVTAQYSSSNPAITDVSMLVTEGKRVGVTGRTGSGKSSLVLTLLNFIGYTGEITIDGIDISKIPRYILRTRITTITQEVIMLEGTVRHNLFPWQPRDLGLKDRVPDFSMITFLESLGIWAHIESEGGLDAELSEVGLSEGQMQLFSVARGMVHNLATSSRIVILDEPTSNLDPAAEEVVLRVLKDALYDHTILLLSHNPEIMTDLDSVTRMENGRIVEDPEQDDKEAKEVKSKSSKSAGKKKAKSNATASSSTEPPPVEPYYQKLMDHMDNPAENPPPFPPRRTAVARLKRKYKRTYGIDAAPTWL